MDFGDKLPPLPDAPKYDIRERGEDQRFEYHMIQVPPTIVVREAKGREAADYLQNVVNRNAHEGWEFYRVDEIGVHVTPGCLAALVGVRAETVSHYVITFRRRAAR